jgi:hypothetical protein
MLDMIVRIDVGIGIGIGEHGVGLAFHGFHKYQGLEVIF